MDYDGEMGYLLPAAFLCFHLPAFNCYCVDFCPLFVLSFGFVSHVRDISPIPTSMQQIPSPGGDAPTNWEVDIWETAVVARKEPMYL